MSKEKPAYHELSVFGKCVIDTHLRNGLVGVYGPNAPETSLSDKNKILSMRSIDRIMAFNFEVADACAEKHKLPLPHSQQQYSREARIPSLR